jgi:adenylate cyclase
VSTESQHPVAFGPFRLDRRGRSLTRAGTEVSLGRRAFDLLCVLAAAGGEAVSKDVLLDQVWPGLTVEENNLQVQISALRKALGDGMIATIPGRGYRLTMMPSDGKPSPDTTAGKPSIAVLPFTNMSGDIEQEYFADGVADDIITELARVRSLFVIARNSSFAYKGRVVDVRQIASELGVRYILEGRVRRGADRLRISAQLIDAETGNHVWVDRFDRPVQDLFALQDEIASTVARAISPAIATAELRRAMRKPPGSLDAWEAYQRGLSHLLTQKSEEIPRAREHFLAALTADPTLSGAYTGLAWLHIMESGAYGLAPFEGSSRMAAEQARKAVAADPNDPYAHAMLAFALSNLQNWKGVADHVERALAISPSCATAYHVRGMNRVFSGHPSEGRSDLFLALQFDPHRSGLPLIQVAVSYYMQHNYEKAVEVLNGMVADHPSHPLANMRLAASLGQLGRKEEARRTLEIAMTLTPESFRRYTEARPPWLRPEDHEHMLDGLRKAGWQD